MTRTGAGTQLSSSFDCKDDVLWASAACELRICLCYCFNAGFAEKSSIHFPIIFVNKRKLCVCQSSTQIWKVCLAICTSPPACPCHSLINHGVIRCWNTSALGIYLVSLQHPEKGKILHFVLHRITLSEQILQSPMHFMTGSLSWDFCGLFTA